MRVIFLIVIAGFANALGTAQASVTDASPRILSSETFQISAEDEAAGIRGIMRLAVEINAVGDVTNAFVFVAPEWPCNGKLGPRVSSIIKDAETAVRKYKFSPEMVNGKHVASKIALSIPIGQSAVRADRAAPSPPTRVDTSIIEGGVLNGKATVLPIPIYPAEAKRQNVKGTVEIRTLIDEEGKVISAQAVSGPGLLQFPARMAACAARFSKTRLNGLPVQVNGTITYNFQ